MKKLIFICLIIFSTSVSINGQNVPVNLQVRFILKIISMDKNISRLGNPIKIGVSSDGPNYGQYIKNMTKALDAAQDEGP